MNVVFRKFRTGEVIALFCGSAKDCNPGMVMSYMHIGQHGEASRAIGRNLKLATPEEYAPLLAELQRIYAPIKINPVKRLYVNPTVYDLWEQMDEFTRAYIGAALWSSNDESDESGGNPMDSNYDQFDIAPSAMAEIIADCRAFQRENAELLAQAYERYIPRDGYKGAALAGHDFWLNRNGHGVGFWDRPELEENGIGEKLSEAAIATGERHLYIHRGKVYQE